MRKEKSFERAVYEGAYRQFRMGYTDEKMWEYWTFEPEATKAADYSYQAKSHQVTGWTSRIRRARFIYIVKYKTMMDYGLIS